VPFVIDASIVLAWAFKEEFPHATTELADAARAEAVPLVGE
jgi:hypothetical protein